MAARGWVAVFTVALALACAALGCGSILGIADLSAEAEDAAPGDGTPADVSRDALDAGPDDAAPLADGKSGGDGVTSDAAPEEDAPSVVFPAPVVIGVTQATTSLVGVTPAGAAKGDQLFFALGAYDQTAVKLTPPASGGAAATLLDRVNHASGGNDDIMSAVYVLTLVGTPDPTYRFTQSGGNANAIDVVTLCVRGGASVGAIAMNDGYSDGPTGAGLATSEPDELLVWYWYGDDHALTAPPAGFTAQVDGTSGPNNLSGGYNGEYTGVAVDAGSIPGVPATASGADDWVVFMLAIEPAGP